MNTTAKGTLFENEVYAFFRESIERGEWGAPHLCKLRHKPAYFSKDRDDHIEFDLSIDIYSVGGDRPTLIILVECKDYGHSVPVKDVEEFFDKMKQVHAHKGILASRNGFQSGALKLATTRNLGLLRLFSKSEHKWMLRRATAGTSYLPSGDEIKEMAEALVDESFEAWAANAVFHNQSGPTCSVWEFMDGLIGRDDPAIWQAIRTDLCSMKPRVPFLDETSIESLAIQIGHRSGFGDSPDLESLCEHERTRSGLKVIIHTEAPLGVRVTTLGSIDFSSNAIELFQPHARHAHHMRFTLAHELGHYFLGHAQFLSFELCDESDLTGIVAQRLGMQDVRRLEWQANRFAAALLMPRDRFIKAALELLAANGIKDKGFGALYVDEQPVNQIGFSKVCSDLARRFDVSFGAVAVRLNQLGILNDKRWVTAGRLFDSQLFN